MIAQRMQEKQLIVSGTANSMRDDEIDAGSSTFRSAVEDDGVSNGYALVSRMIVGPAPRYFISFLVWNRGLRFTLFSASHLSRQVTQSKPVRLPC